MFCPRVGGVEVLLGAEVGKGKKSFHFEGLFFLTCEHLKKVFGEDTLLAFRVVPEVRIFYDLFWL